MPTRRTKILAGAVIAFPFLLLLYPAKTNPPETASPTPLPKGKPQNVATLPAEIGESKFPPGISQDNHPPPVSEQKDSTAYTDEELRAMKLMVMGSDGAINPEFFRVFGFSSKQAADFEKIWANKLDLLQRIERRRIFDYVAESGSTKFWIGEFPEEGKSLKNDLTGDLEGKIPDQAGKFLLEINDYDREYTFSDFGKYRRSFEITNTREGYLMIETFFHVSDEGLTMKGSRKHEFQTPPARFQMLLTDKAK